MASDETILRLKDAKGVDWKTAASAYVDAKKELTPKKVEGLAGLKVRNPSEEDIERRALELLDQPARQPAAVEGLKQLKKTTKLAIAICRDAMERSEHDHDRALALLVEEGKFDPQAKPAAKKRAKKGAQKKATPRPKLTRRVEAGLVRGEDVLLMVTRRHQLTRDQKRVFKDLERNGEHPGHVQDLCVVQGRGATWKRITPFFRGIQDWALTRDGSLHLLLRHRPEGGGPSRGRVRSWNLEGEEAAVSELDAQMIRLEGPDGLVTTPSPIRPHQEHVWWRGLGGEWRRLPLPEKRHLIAGLGVIDGVVWATATGYLGRYDVAAGTWTEVPAPLPHESGWAPEPFARLVVGPDGRVVAHRRRGGGSGESELWIGTAEGLAPVAYGDQSRQLLMVGEHPVYDRAGNRLILREGNQEHVVLDSDDEGWARRTPRIFGDGAKLLAATDSRLLQMNPDRSWEHEPLKAMWDVVGDDDLWWSKSPPDWFPKRTLP